MNFLNPHFIHAAWLGLIPIAIHFWNKKKLDSRMWGTLRFFPDSSTSTKQTIHLHHIWLLLIRLLMIFIATLWLMHPVQERVLPFDNSIRKEISSLAEFQAIISDSATSIPKLSFANPPEYLPNLPIELIQREIQTTQLSYSSNVPSTLKKVLNYVIPEASEMESEINGITIQTDFRRVFIKDYPVTIELKSQTVCSSFDELFELEYSWEKPTFSGKSLWQNESGESLVWSRADTLFMPSIFLDENWTRSHPLVAFHLAKLIQSEVEPGANQIVSKEKFAFESLTSHESKRPIILLTFLLILGVERVYGARSDV